MGLGLADELRATGSEAGDDGVDVLDHEREMAEGPVCWPARQAGRRPGSAANGA
jgi:hypothetical protein